MNTGSTCSLQQIPEESQGNVISTNSSLSLDTISSNTSMDQTSDRPTDRTESSRLEESRQSKQNRSKSHSRLQSLDSILHSEFKTTGHERQVTTLATKVSTGSDAATLLASCRRSVQSDSEQPSVPARTTSVARPAKRKRHEDYVAFHRQSCQLFSSIDSTLLQMRMSTLSSSASSSISSSRSSTSSTPSSSPSSPDCERSTRETSIDSDLSQPEESSSIVKTDSTKPTKLVRPTLQRMSYTTPLPPVHSTVSVLNETASRAIQIPQLSQAPNSAQRPTVSLTHSSIPPKTTTQPCYSSQTTLSIPPMRSSTSGINTVIQWTSPETRAREYAKIDAANSGFRLFLRKVCPQTLAKKVGGGRNAFWNDSVRHNHYDHGDDNERETDDCGGSIRRYRIDNRIEEHDNDIDEEKDDADSTEKEGLDEEYEPCSDFNRGTRTQSWIPFLGRAKSMPVESDSRLDEKKGNAEARPSISMMFRRMSTYRL